jgi:hypothetical protein
MGSQGVADSVDKVVRLKPDTSYSHAEYGTSVEFTEPSVKGTPRSFVWRFDGWPRDFIDLEKVAPPGFVDHKVLVYISLDPTILGG